jgi:hypothetical protein
MSQHAPLFRNAVDEHLIRGSRRPAAVQQLLLEWREIAHSPAAAGMLNRWAQTYPALTGHADLAALVDHVDQAEEAETDEILRALVFLAQEGHDLAGRVVLQLMLPALSSMERKCTLDAATDEDRWQILLLAFLTAIQDLNPQRRFASCLMLDTLRIATRPFRYHSSEDAWRQDKPASLDDDVTMPVEADSGEAYALRSAIDYDSGLEELLVWAVQGSVLTVDEAQLMANSYLQDRRLEAGLSEADRRRRSRVRRKLIEAVRAHVTGLDQDVPQRASRAA